jgi:hypothetical protein
MSVVALLVGASAPLQSQTQNSYHLLQTDSRSGAALHRAGDRVARRAGESVPDMWFTPPPVDSTRPHSPSTARYAVIGAVIGGVVGAVWIGNEASHGYPGNEAALSPDSARMLGAVVGIVTGAGIGALVAWIRRSEASSNRRGS